MWSLSLFASLFADRDDPLTRPEIVWGTVGLTVALLVGAAVIYAVDKWRKRTAAGSADETGSLTSFREMYEAGEITEAEYAELKRRLAEKVKKQPLPSVPAANAAPAAPVLQPGERATTNPPAPSPKPTESPPPPSTA